MRAYHVEQPLIPGRLTAAQAARHVQHVGTHVRRELAFGLHESAHLHRNDAAVEGAERDLEILLRLALTHYPRQRLEHLPWSEGVLLTTAVVAEEQNRRWRSHLSSPVNQIS